MIKPLEKNSDGKKFVKSLGKEIVAVKKDNRYIFIYFVDKVFTDIRIQNADELPIGTKCVGKINKISKDINAAFVLLPDKSTAFLKNINSDMKCEMSIPVEIVRASSKGKLCSVIMTDDDISHRTDLSIIKYGVSPLEELFEYSPDRIIAESSEIFDYILENMKKYNENESNDSLNTTIVSVYSDNMISLYSLYSVSKCIEDATSKTVWLKSGANITIEHTTAFTVIDVNSGKRISKQDDGYLDINLEAATEIFRQMNLRNLSGIILIDFINMDKEDEVKLLSNLNELAKSQNCPTKIVDITRLGIAEITRKKRGLTIYDLI